MELGKRILESLLSSDSETIAAQSGLNKAELSSGLESAIPAVLGLLGNHRSQLEGLLSSLDKNKNGSFIDDLLGMLQPGQAAGGSDFNPLSMLLGGLSGKLGQSLSTSSALSGDQLSKLIQTSLPSILSHLKSHAGSMGLDDDQLNSALAREKDHAKSTHSGLASLFDQDGDGQVMDDIGSLVGKLFG
jgi:hypothetical protein